MASNNLLELLYGQKQPETRKRGEDSMRATPERSPAALGLSRALKAAHEFGSRPFGYDNPPVAMISEGLGIPALAQTLERIGYGEPLTTGAGGIGGTTRVRPEVLDAAMAVAPIAPMTKGLRVGASIKPLGTTKKAKAFIEQPMWHGGSYKPGDEITQPLYMTPTEAMARSYADPMRIPGATLQQLVPAAKNPAPERLVNAAARKYVPENRYFTPASAFDPNLHDPEDIAALIRELERRGYDSAMAGDVGMGGNYRAKGEALVLFPGSKAHKAPERDQPFWHNPATGAHETFDISGMHNAVIQDPAYAAKLGVTTEEAMQPTSTLLMGRTERKNPEALNLMQVAPPTPESIEAIKKMLISQQLPHKTVNFSAGENLFEGIPVDELLKAEGLSPLKSYQQYAMGGSVNIPDDFTTPDMSDGGAILPDTEYVRSPLQQVR